VYADRVQLFKGSAIIQGQYTYLRVGLARTIYIRECTVFLAGKSPNVRSYAVYIYGSGQPYSRVIHLFKGSALIQGLSRCMLTGCSY